MFKIFKIFVLFSFFLIVSCETITDWTESIIPGDEDVIDNQVDSQQLVSDAEQLRDPTLAEILAESENEDGLELVDEQLSATPTQEYDSILISEDEETQKPNNQISQTTDVFEDKSNQSSEAFENDIGILEQADSLEEEASNAESFKPTENLITSLNLAEKIQYRVATINFRSGSSSVDGKGLKKIKKIVKVAKERNAKIKIIGHASERTRDMPIAEHKIVNFIISDKRAHSVAKIFIEKYDFPKDKLITEAVSDSKPLFKEIMPAGTTANQRTEIFLIY